MASFKQLLNLLFLFSFSFLNYNKISKRYIIIVSMRKEKCLILYYGDLILILSLFSNLNHLKLNKLNKQTIKK
jgi:hypothetical protein